MTRLHNTQYAWYGQGRAIHNTLYNTCYGQDYTIHMLLPSLRNTQYQRGHNPHNDVPSFWSPCGLMCLTEDSSATFGGIHQSKGNQYVLIEMVKGRARGVRYLNVCDENYPTLAFDDKIMLNHAKDLRPVSLWLSLLSSFAYEVLA